MKFTLERSGSLRLASPVASEPGSAKAAAALKNTTPEMAARLSAIRRTGAKERNQAGIQILHSRAFGIDHVSRHVFPVPIVPTAHGPAGARAGIPNTLPLPDWIEFGRVGVAVADRLTAGEGNLSVAPANVN